MPDLVNNNVRETFARTIIEVGLSDPRLVCVVSDISHFRLLPLYESRPNQYFNLGVCENSIVNVAAGLAALGKIPVIHTFASFLIDRSFEQIKISFGYHKLPVNIVVIGSGNEYAFHGVTHHSYADSAFIKTIEGSYVFNPGSTYEFDQLFKDNYENGCVNLYRATTRPHQYAAIDSFPVIAGTPIVTRRGRGVTILCTGGDLKLAWDFSVVHPEYDPEIIYLHTLKPLNPNIILESISKTRKFVTLEHQSHFGGLYQDILALLANNGLNGFSSAELSLGSQFIRQYGNADEQDISLGFSIKNLAEIVKSIQS